MRATGILSFALFAAVAVVCVRGDESGDVTVLTDKNFQEIIKKESLVLVKFFAPWCGHCQAMAEDFKSAATELKGKAVLAEVDATKEEKIAQDYHIEGFPTLKLFSNGEELTDYQGNRDKESMVKFVERAMLPAFETIDDAAGFKKLLGTAKGKSIVVGVDLGKETQAKFTKAAYSVRDVVENIEFAVVKAPAAIADLVKAVKNEVYFVTSGEEDARKAVKYDSEKYNTIDKFAQTEALPVFQEFTQSNAQIYVELGMPVIVGFFEKEAATFKDNTALMGKIAKKKAGNGKAAFAWVDAVELQTFVDYVGLTDKEPKICAYNFETDEKFLVPPDFKLTEASFESWVDDFIAGKLEPSRKSQPVPEENPGPVYTVVGDSWEDIVQDKKVDVFVSQIAPWCGHCKALKPIYAKVAEELKKAGITTLKLAQMDATENDAPGEYKAKGFPTVHFFPAGEGKEGIEFDGDRTSKGIIDWLKEKATNKFEFDTSTLGEDPEPEEDEDEGEGDEGEEGDYDGDENLDEGDLGEGEHEGDDAELAQDGEAKEEL